MNNVMLVRDGHEALDSYRQSAAGLLAPSSQNTQVFNRSKFIQKCTWLMSLHHADFSCSDDATKVKDIEDISFSLGCTIIRKSVLLWLVDVLLNCLWLPFSPPDDELAEIPMS